MSLISPDSIIAPWLEKTHPSHLWIIGPEIPPVVLDYQSYSKSKIQTIKPQAISSDIFIPKAALCVEPIENFDNLITLGRLRNLLIPDLLCFVSNEIPKDDLFSLAFQSGLLCQNKKQYLLSLHYSLATYNHTRSWNNPKLWANPENWNKYWW